MLTVPVRFYPYSQTGGSKVHVGCHADEDQVKRLTGPRPRRSYRRLNAGDTAVDGAADLWHSRTRGWAQTNPRDTPSTMVVTVFPNSHRSVAGEQARGGATPAGSRIMGYGWWKCIIKGSLSVDTHPEVVRMLDEEDWRLWRAWSYEYRGWPVKGNG
jgi:hypothetical protein